MLFRGFYFGLTNLLALANHYCTLLYITKWTFNQRIDHEDDYLYGVPSAGDNLL